MTSGWVFNAPKPSHRVKVQPHCDGTTIERRIHFSGMLSSALRLYHPLSSFHTKETKEHECAESVPVIEFSADQMWTA